MCPLRVYARSAVRTIRLVTTTRGRARNIPRTKRYMVGFRSGENLKRNSYAKTNKEIVAINSNRTCREAAIAVRLIIKQSEWERSLGNWMWISNCTVPPVVDLNSEVGNCAVSSCHIYWVVERINFIKGDLY